MTSADRDVGRCEGSGTDPRISCGDEARDSLCADVVRHDGIATNPHCLTSRRGGAPDAHVDATLCAFTDRMSPSTQLGRGEITAAAADVAADSDF